MVTAAVAETKRRERLTKELARLDLEVVAAAHRCFEGDAEAAAWLLRPLHSLGRKEPVMLARSTAGRQRVLSLLGAIERGVFM